MLEKLSVTQKAIIIGVVVFIVACLVIGGVVAIVVSTSKVNAPAGTAKTDSFTFTATLNGVVVADPANINLPAGFIGDSSTVVYTITSTANQAITVNAVTTAGTLDKSSISLPANGNTGTISLTVALTGIAQVITVSFTSSP